MQRSIGIATIGQSPRPDVVRDIAVMFGEDVKLIEKGALDGFSLDQVSQYSPEREMVPLVTRMKDGTEVVVAKEKILQRISGAIHELNEEKVSLILLLCVGTFPRFESSCLVIEPQRIVEHCVSGLIDRNHRLGILLPAQGQEAWAMESFSHITQKISIAIASPYREKEDLVAASKVLKDEDCDLIVMYCMGFNSAHAQEVRLTTEKPVILAISIVARTICELIA